MTAEAGTLFEVFFDGDCPLCRREIAFLRRLDRRRNVIRFTDIAEPDFDPVVHGLGALGTGELMARIHGRASDGEIVEGVEVFRRLYAAVGLEALVALTRLRPIAAVLDAAYRWFAANRLRLTGPCDDGACEVRHSVLAGATGASSSGTHASPKAS